VRADEKLTAFLEFELEISQAKSSILRESPRSKFLANHEKSFESGRILKFSANADCNRCFKRCLAATAGFTRCVEGVLGVCAYS
jgi:hypothetical protein